MPSLDVMDSVPSNAANTKSENQKSVKVLDELLSKLTISKTADETSAAAGNIATFINGSIEEHDAPTKYVSISTIISEDCGVHLFHGRINREIYLKII